MRDLPGGTVTFLFTDVEGSTRMLKELRDGYADVLAEHQRILREAFEAAGGQEIDTQGDSFFVAFRRAKEAVTAAVAAQRELAAHRWPKSGAVRVRMGLHTGEPTVGDERYVGMGVHKAARIAAAAHGGQILLSNTTRGLVEDELPPDLRLIDLGEHRLKDIDLPERIFQLNSPGLPHRFPPLRLEAPLPRSRVWSSGRMPRQRALLVAAAGLLVAAAIVGIAVAMGWHEAQPASSASTAATTTSGSTAPGSDSDRIVPGKSIGALKLDMSKSGVEALYGSGRESPWRARGRGGVRVTYSAPGGTLSASYYGGKVVQVATSSSYYRTDDGLGVNFVIPPLWTPAELKNAIRAGDVEEIESGVYTWHDFVVDRHARAFCLREETAGTQLAIKAGLANRIGGVFITNARFLAYLPAVIPRTAGLPPREAFCAAEPLEP
jgi:class 3 adenylate cyclase